MPDVTLLMTAQVLAVLVTVVTFWGLLPLDHWWVRGVDFPRIQILILAGAVYVAMLLVIADWQFLQWVIMVGLTLAIAYQLRMVLPYTLLWQKQVQQASDRPNSHQIKIMVSNVLTSNDNTQALLDLVQDKQPDVLMTLESDLKWQQALQPIEADYPYTVKVPLDNLYGMHLYSKLELIDPQVKYLVIDDIPSIHTQLRLKTGKLIWLYCLHPMPPSPTEADKSTTRDAELLMVGRHIKDNDQVAILAGDLNDVAWSKTTRMFQRISGLLDPRVGRHFINTFHARYPFMRWALDHIFHSPCFTLVRIERLPYIGSDHFPVFTILQYEAQVVEEQQHNVSDACADDEAQSHDKIIEGKIEGRRVSEQRDESGDAASTIPQNPDNS